MLNKNTPFFLKPLLFVLMVILVLPACQPEIEGDVPPPAVDNKPKTYTEIFLDGTDTLSAETYNLSYNSNGKLVSLISASNPGDKFIYTYSTSKFTLDLYQSNIIVLTATYFLNASSKVDSSVQYEIGSTDTTTEKYIYTGQQLTTIRRYSNSSGSYMLEELVLLEYDASGNVIKETSTIDGVTTYTYYSNLTNPLKIFPDEAYSAPYLVKTTSTSSYMLTHTYTFDTQQRLVEEKAVETSGLILIRKYTY